MGLKGSKAVLTTISSDLNKILIYSPFCISRHRISAHIPLSSSTPTGHWFGVFLTAFASISSDTL